MSAAIAIPAGRRFGKLGAMEGREREPADAADEPIARALASDDPAAIEAIWREYADGVLAVALRGVGERAAAEDVRQQVFAELWERRASYDPDRGTVRAWVMTIARSRTIDHLRRRVPTADTEAVERARAPAAGGAFESPEAAVERIGVAELLRRIPARESGLLRMRFYDGLSQREIAERTGMPLGTVKMRMVQALERMRGLLEEGSGP